MRPTHVVAWTGLACLSAAPVAAQDVPAPSAAASSDVGSQGSEGSRVRRDPRGIKGISPFWESVNRGDAAYLARDFESAILAYRDALTKQPQNPQGHYRMGAAQLAKGALDEARASWESALRFANADPAMKAKALFVLADLDERERKLAEATNQWMAYEGHAKLESKVKSFPETAVERKKRIGVWTNLQEQYAAVKERIEKRMKEVDAKK